MTKGTLVECDELKQDLGQEDLFVIDTRNEMVYNRGHIPGAKWLERYHLMRHKQGIPWFKSSKEILTICEELEIYPDTTIYLYCFKGAHTSNTMMALKNAGFRDVRNYPLSWNEWSRHESLPIEEGYE